MKMKQRYFLNSDLLFNRILWNLHMLQYMLQQVQQKEKKTDLMVKCVLIKTRVVKQYILKIILFTNHVIKQMSPKGFPLNVH